MSIGALSYGRARRALEAAAATRLELLALDVARNLQGELANRAADITTWSRLETMVALTFDDVDKELAELLRHAVEGRRTFRALAAFDAGGRLVASAGDAGRVPQRLERVDDLRLRVVPAPPGRADLVVEGPVFNPRRPAEPIGSLDRKSVV